MSATKGYIRIKCGPPVRKEGVYLMSSSDDMTIVAVGEHGEEIDITPYVQAVSVKTEAGAELAVCIRLVDAEIDVAAQAVIEPLDPPAEKT